ncbi:MAG: response regulator transcription factor [Nitrospiraceae bacterium]|nr:MAG: response regulator transcription factor [Nitrospiraceae bacterium]
MRILLSFSNQLMALGINCILSGNNDIKVSICSSAHLGDTLKDKFFDIIIVDMHVLENYLYINECTSKVLLMDTVCDVQAINYALIAGRIHGILDVSSDREMLLKSFNTVMKDNLWISKKCMKQLLVRLSELSRLWNLKSIDLDILGLIGTGMDNDMIARTIGTNTRNVRLRINNIQKKSDVTDRCDLITLSKQFFVFDSSDHDHIH